MVGAEEPFDAHLSPSGFGLAAIVRHLRLAPATASPKGALMKRVIVALCSALALLGSVLAAPSSAQATSEVYVVHGVPGLTVDVYVNDALTLPDFDPKDVAGPLTLPEGDYQIEIFAAAYPPAGSADDRTDAAAIDETVPLPGEVNVSLVAHLDGAGTPTITAFANDLSPVESGTTGRVTIRHTAAAPAVDIVAAGAPVGNLVDIQNGEQESIDLPAGTYPTGIAAAGSTEALVDAPVTVQPGVGLVVYAIGDLAGGTFDLAVQTFNGLALRDEYRNTTGSEGEIARLYLAMLARTPDADGFQYWVEQREQGVGLTRIVQMFDGTPEFEARFAAAKNGTDGEWVDFVYGNVLGRTPDDGGRAYWISRIDDGSLTRHDLLAYFSESPEFREFTGTN